MKEYNGWEINMINKFPDLSPEEAIAEGKKLAAKGGAKAKGRKADWAHFKNPAKARQAGLKGSASRWGAGNKK